MVVSHVLACRVLLARTVIVLPLVALAVTGCGTAAKNDTFDLSGTPSTATGRRPKRSQILVPEPTALKALDSEQIVIRVSPSEIQYLARSQWSDRLPRMVQSKLVEAYENSGKLGGVGKPGQGLAIDYQVVTEIRSFEIDAGAGNQAVVEISAKILNDRNGTVRTQKVFRAATPAGGGSSEGYVKALDRAFSAVTAQIVNWTLTSI